MNKVIKRHTQYGFDELTPEDHAEVTEGIAIGFALWISDNGWMLLFEIGWVDQYWGKAYATGYTTKELYDLYVTTLNK